MKSIEPSLHHVNSRWPAIPVGTKAFGLVDGVPVLKDSMGAEQSLASLSKEELDALIATDPAATMAALTDDFGTINLGNVTIGSGAFYEATTSVILPGQDGSGGDQYSYFGWVDDTGADKAGLYWWDSHSGGGELIIDSSARIALAPGINGAIQIGLATPGSLQWAYLQNRGPSTASITTTDSLPLYFTSSRWNGSASELCTGVGLQGVGTATGDGELMFFADSSRPNDLGTDGTRTEIVSVTKDGFRNPGNYPAHTVLTDGATITWTVNVHHTVQTASIELAGDRTLAMSGVVAGMRGVLFVSQDGTGTRLLTLPDASAKESGFALSTAPLSIDRLTWEYDGTYYYWTISNGIQLPADADATAFISAASVTDSTETNAVNTLAVRLKAEGLWDKLYAIYPFLGSDSANASLSHSKDLKGTANITDDAAWQAATHDANGITGDGSTAYGKLGFGVADAGGQDSISIAVYSKSTTVTQGGYILGLTEFGVGYSGLLRQNSATDRFAVAGLNLNNQSTVLIGVSPNWKSFIAVSRDGATSQRIRANGVTTENATASTVVPNNDFCVLARGTGGADNFSNANLAFAAVGSGLTASELLTLEGIVETFQTTLGRQNT